MNPKSPRLVVVAALLLAAVALMAPQAASASSGQLTLLQDDRELLGGTGEDPAAAMAEIRRLGVDVIRTNVIYYRVFNKASRRTKPANFNAGDPNSPYYNFASHDRLVQLAKDNGLQVEMTVTGPGPHFSSSSPGRCRRVPCTYKPRPSEFGKFAAAVAKRYRGKIDYWSVWNEPNLKVWLTPRFKNTSAGVVDLRGAMYRKLFQAGYKSIAKYDPARRNRVLFGETAAIGSPLPMLRAALCLDARGRPFKGRLRALQGCSGHVSRLNIGGFAVHPYNQAGGGTPQTRTKTKTSLPVAYLPRLHRLTDAAVRRGRMGSRGKGVYMTEYGFQSNPPDTVSGVSLANQARFINESDRLFYADPRVKAVAQYELTDVPERDQFNTGLRFVRSRGGEEKPAYAAYRIPLVVSKRSTDSVEVYGQVRPSRILAGGPFTTVDVQVSENGGPFTTVAQPQTNRRGIFRVNVTRSGASSARWRLAWQNPDTSELLTSREATAGARLRYFKG